MTILIIAADVPGLGRPGLGAQRLLLPRGLLHALLLPVAVLHIMYIYIYIYIRTCLSLSLYIYIYTYVYIYICR